MCACLLLPVVGLQEKGLSKLLSAVAGVGVSAIGYMSYRDNRKLVSLTEDLGIVERKQTIAWYNRLLTQKQQITANLSNTKDVQVLSDVVSYWMQQDKHLLIVGGTGAGKSTFIQSFASVLGSGWHYKVYDSDCTVDDWLYLRSLPSCQMYETFAEICVQMAEDLETIETRTLERKQTGNRWTTDNTLIVAEEMPALVDEIEDAGVWLSKHAKRGRRVKRFVAAVVQNDTVRNLGLEGDSKLRDSCFVRVYLGQSAIERAQTLKNAALEDWLKTGGMQVCLVDDKPAMRPTLAQKQPQPTAQVHLSLQQRTAETLAESQCSDVHDSSAACEIATKAAESEALERTLLLNQPLTNVQVSAEQVQALRQLHLDGWSISSILEQKLGQKRGGSWQKKKQWLNQLLSPES